MVPYVSVESTILKQNSDPEDLFKSALNSFSENSSQRHSPTPCEEIDVIESARDKLNNENANQTFEVDEEERTETPIAEPEVTGAYYKTNYLFEPSITYPVTFVTLTEIFDFLIKLLVTTTLKTVKRIFKKNF